MEEEKDKNKKHKPSKIGSSNIERRVFWFKMFVVMSLVFAQVLLILYAYGIMRE